VRESGAVPTIDGLPVFFRPRYPNLEDDTGEFEDSPKGVDPDAVTPGERESDSNPVIWTQIPDQRFNELSLDHLAQATLTPS
jgi:hypothetical protein